MHTCATMNTHTHACTHTPYASQLCSEATSEINTAGNKALESLPGVPVAGGIPSLAVVFTDTW